MRQNNKDISLRSRIHRLSFVKNTENIHSACLLRKRKRKRIKAGISEY